MNKAVRKICISLALVFITLLSFFPFSAFMAIADGISVQGGYTTVLEDLKTDKNFNEAEYPIKNNDCTLEVITIAESSENELFVYVYQPHQEHGKYKASSINISATDDNSLDIMNYPLMYVNHNGVFQKYLVTGITLPTGTTRYYDVVSIYRVFDESIDKGLDDDNDNTINEVVFKVGKLYTLTTTEDGINVHVNDTDVIKVTKKYVGFCRYPVGHTGWGDLTFYAPGCDNHFVAFSTDKPIDKLLEADVYYKTQAYLKTYYNMLFYDEESYGEIVPNYAYLTYTDKVEVTIPNGLFRPSYTYSWNRIQTVEDFISTENREYIYDMGMFNLVSEINMTDESLQNLRECTWVLRFAETEYRTYSVGSPTITTHTEKTIVSNVTILRLKFETDGKIYNLGVVDNKQSGSLTPDNEVTIKMELKDTFRIIMAVLLLILLVVILSPFLPLVIKLVTAPFRFVIRLFRRR